MTPTHVITLFGPETPGLFAARTPNASVLWAGIACSPCVNTYNNRQSACRDNLCMQTITVDQVSAGVMRIYDDRIGRWLGSGSGTKNRSRGIATKQPGNQLRETHHPLGGNAETVSLLQRCAVQF